MNKSEFIKALAGKTGLSISKLNTVLSAEKDIIVNNTKQGKKTLFVDFGSFKKEHRNARKGRNPQTGKPLKIAARDVPVFKAGSGFKKAVNA